MAETPEIPEVEDSFSKRIAISIAAIAAIMSVVGNKGDDAKTEAILKTTEAANQWSYFQAKSIKATTYEIALEEARWQATADAAKHEAMIAKFTAKTATYESEKAEIKAKAEELGIEAAHDSKINNRTDEAVLVLQMAIILCSVAILIKSRWFWFTGLGAGAIGAAIGATAFFM